MKIQTKFHSEHVEALKKEIKLKFKEELSKDAHDGYLKRKAQEAIDCLEYAVVSVDILRSLDFNPRLDSKKNFYGLKLDIFTTDGHLIARNSNIRKSLQMSMQMMNKKDMWKFFLSTTLMELQLDEKVDLMLRVGSDHKFPTDKDTNDTADFVVVGPNPKMDFPLLIGDISTGPTTDFSPKKLQNMMTTTLIDMFNTRRHWPLTELVHLCVYGIIARNDEFYLSRMALRPERGTKLAFVYTSGKRVLPRNLFTKPETSATFGQEAYAQSRRGDADSTDDEEYESEEDEWFTCHSCQTCHYRGEYSSDDEYGQDCIFEYAWKKIKKPAAPAPSKTISERHNGASAYRRPHGGSVTTIVSLMQTVQAKYKMIKEKDQKYKHLKPK